MVDYLPLILESAGFLCFVVLIDLLFGPKAALPVAGAGCIGLGFILERGRT